MIIFLLIGTLYCLLPQSQDKNVMIIKNDIHNSDKNKDIQSQLQRQVIHTDASMQQTPTIRVAPSNNNIKNLNTNMSTGGGHIFPVIVKPTQLVPLLPAANQSVLKRTGPPHTSVTTIVPQPAQPIIVKPQGKSSIHRQVANKNRSNHKLIISVGRCHSC